MRLNSAAFVMHTGHEYLLGILCFATMLSASSAQEAKSAGSAPKTTLIASPREKLRWVIFGGTICRAQ